MRDSWMVKDEVRDALGAGRPVLAFRVDCIDSRAPIPHKQGFGPWRVESVARNRGCVPATIGIVDGVIHVGMTPEEIDQLAGNNSACKASGYDIAFVVASGRSAGVTVSGTLAIGATCWNTCICNRAESEAFTEAHLKPSTSPMTLRA